MLSLGIRLRTLDRGDRPLEPGCLNADLACNQVLAARSEVPWGHDFLVSRAVLEEAVSAVHPVTQPLQSQAGELSQWLSAP